MIKIDYSDFLPRTQVDRYNHAILEQLILLNENIAKLIPKEVKEEVKTPKKKKKGDADGSDS
jgi:hypothetical protein